jgi:O-antigen/teichoic acid export membrane protein
VQELTIQAQTLHTDTDSVAEVLDSRQAGGMIVRGGILRFGSYTATVGLSVISATLLTRHLGVSRFGEYTTVLSLVGVVTAVTDAGMSTIGTREFAVREGHQRDALMQNLLGLRVTLTVIGVLLVAGFALAAGYETELLLGAVLASVGTIALMVQHTYTIPLSASLRLGMLSSLELGRQVLTVAALVTLVLLGGGLLPLLAVGLAVNLVLIPPTAALARHQIPLRITVHPQQWLKLLKLTLSFSLATAVGTIYVFTAQILTSLMASAHQTGLFAASFRIFSVLGLVPSLLVSSALPLLARAARHDRQRLTYALERIFEVSMILGVATALGTFTGAQFMIQVIAGAKYGASVTVLQIQGLALIATFALAGWSYALLSLERYKGLLLANLAAFLVSCTLTSLLAGVDGAKGAAVATVCAESVLALGTLAALLRGHPELRPRLGIVVKVGGAAVAAATLALAVGTLPLLRPLIALAAYTVLIVLARAVPAELIELLPARLRQRPTSP